MIIGPHLKEAVLALGTNEAGTHATVSFNRIDDPMIIYSVIADDTLANSTWTPIWTSTGTDPLEGRVKVIDPQPMIEVPQRFFQLRVEAH